MPASSLIVGVDLAPIKPIPRAITFQSDITSDKCRATIRQHFKTWKADTVLHDGAPNVGIAWVQDAFSQAELALQALKLATEFLVEGGTFVTKVFRSKDYNALLWVCNQLFAKVEATKPPSSRNVSAEIFVVCRGFKAPKRIDPRLLDSRSVFAELSEAAPNNEAKVFNPEKKKRKRQGYEEGDHTQFKEAPASHFIQTTDPIAMLGTINRLSFLQPPNGDIALAALDKLPETTQEVRDCCNDLRVLGRKEFRLLLRWRLKARDIFGFRTKKDDSRNIAGEEVAEVTPMDEELKIQEELQRIEEKENGRRKREKRRDNEKKQKEIVRMQMHMLVPTDIGLEQAGPNGEDSMFALGGVDNANALDRVARGRMAVPAAAQDQSSEVDSDGEDESDEEEDRLDRELDTLYSRYQERKSESDAKHRAKKARKEHQDGDWEGLSDKEASDLEEFEEDADSEPNSTSGEEDDIHDSQPLSKAGLVSQPASTNLTRKAAMFFDQEIFKEMGDLVGEADDKDESAMHRESDDENLETIGETEAFSNDFSAPVSRSANTNGNTPSLPIEAASSGMSEQHDVSVKKQVEDDEDLDGQQEGFEVVQDSIGEDWDRQGEPRKEGRLGNTYLLAARLQ